MAAKAMGGGWGLAATLERVQEPRASLTNALGSAFSGESREERNERAMFICYTHSRDTFFAF